MKYLLSVLLIICFSGSSTFAEGLNWQLAFSPDAMFLAKKSKSKRKRSSRKKYFSKESPLNKAKQLALGKQYPEAAKLLFRASRSAKWRRDRSKIKYLLGLMLEKMKLNQVAAFVYFDVINDEAKSGKSSKYLRQSITKLSALSNALDSDVLLKYAISKIKVRDFPKVQKDLFYYRLGELHMKEKKFIKAAKSFSRVESQSSVYPKALYKMGLSYAERKRNKAALTAFDELYQVSQNRGITDVNKADAILGKARVYYQAKKWERAIGEYRKIPRDMPQWHESLFESSWAMMMSGRYFRSALSNFHTLHSSYYENDYAPESLLLRSIVYLFICKYDEMEKVLGLFDKVYKPVRSSIKRFLSGNSGSNTYWKEIKRADRYYRDVKAGKDAKDPGGRLPFMVARYLLKQSNVRKNVNYLFVLEAEQKRLQQARGGWNSSSVGSYAKRILSRRIKSTKALIGKQSRKHLFRLSTELRDFFEQSDFLKFEMISGKKEFLKKRITGKKIRKRITDDEGRDFFIKNGFEYWPFEEEYWLDELGNYHYVGVQACE